jgi:ribosomal-protein-alanine N-acetyltransferase
VHRLELVRADHAPALLTFEQHNRSYFAAAIPDRGDAYFAEFAERHRELLAWQANGTDFFHVLVEDGDDAIVGRVNLTEVADGSAELGYRIAQRAAGHGLATEAVRQVCALAGAGYGLRVLHASSRVENEGSRTVLKRTGFIPTGEVTLSGLPGVRYRRELRPTADVRVATRLVPGAPRRA